MLKIVAIIAFLLSSASTHAQFPFGGEPSQIPKTLYFPYQDDVQLIIIDNYDTYRRYGSWYDGMYPRGGSWFMDHGPAPKNVYLFRDKAGKVVKVFNSDSADKIRLESTTYTNTDDFSLYTISDYTELNKHLMFYGEDNKLGLINLKGEIVVPAIYDEIRKFQDLEEKRDKLIVVKDTKFGFLDSNLHELFPPIYRAGIDSNNADYPEHNLVDGRNIKVFKADKCGLISEEGEVLIDFLFDDIRWIHDSMYIGLTFRNERELTHTITDYWNQGYKVKSCIIYQKDFSVLTKLEDFEYILYFGINRFIVKKDNNFGVVNHLGKTVVPLEYNSLTEGNGAYNVSKNNKRGVVSLDGEILIPCENEDIYFYDQAIYVTQGGLIGVYNAQYKLIATPQFVKKTWDMGKFILTTEDGSKGFVNHDQDNSYYQSPEGQIIKL